LENRESKYDEMSRGMWEAVEVKARKARVAKAKRKGKKKRGGRKMERERKSKERKG